MQAARALAVATALTALLLSGCAQQGPGTQSPSPTQTLTSGQANIEGKVVDGSSFSILLTGFEGHSNPQYSQGEDYLLYTVRNGTTFQYEMQVQGSVSIPSDHIGGHYGPDRDPTTSAPGACTHQSSRIPGTFTITCQAMSTPGIYHLRPHARGGSEGGYVHWWGADFRFRIT
jgi:hypothetical protein